MSPPDEDLPELALRLHVKILIDPTSFTVDQMIAAMRDVFRAARIRVDVASTERLDLPALLSVFVDRCNLGGVTTDHQTLFANRTGAADGDVVVYFVRDTDRPVNGCAVHPPGRPGAVVVHGCTKWTLAHEVGHVLGLRHVTPDDTTRLMHRSTSAITKSPPDLSPEEVARMRASPLVR